MSSYVCGHPYCNCFLPSPDAACALELPKPAPPASHDAGEAVSRYTPEQIATVERNRAEREAAGCYDSELVATLRAQLAEMTRQRDDQFQRVINVGAVAINSISLENHNKTVAALEDTLQEVCRDAAGLREKLAASEARVVVLEKSLRHYGTHSDHCEKSRFVNPSVCTCGYDAALSQPGKGE